MRILRRLSAIPVLLALALGASACGNDHPDDVVRIGVNDIAQPHWDIYRAKAAEQGITVEFVNFTDYKQPNPALAQKRVDLNKFQHVRYLANYNVANNDTLVPIGATEIFPLTLYSKKHTSVADIPRGGRDRILVEYTPHLVRRKHRQVEVLIEFDPVVDEEIDVVIPRRQQNRARPEFCGQLL